MAEICHSGVLPFIGPLDGAVGGDLLPSGLLTSCRPKEGICFSALNRGGVQETVQVGCWPSQSTIPGLAWLGTPQCRPEVKRLVCLFQRSLCNSFVPVWPQQQVPEGDEIEGILVIFLLFFMICLVFGVFCYTISRLCRSQTTSSNHGHQEHDRYIQRATPSQESYYLSLQGNIPPPFIRVYSAPPNLQSDPTRMKPSLNSCLHPPYKCKVTLDSEFPPQGMDEVYDVTDGPDRCSLRLGYKKMTYDN